MCLNQLYKNTQAYYTLEDNKFVSSNKDDVEAFASRTDTGCKKEFAEWIIHAQDHLTKKHDEAKELKKELDKKVDECKELQSNVKEKEEKIQQQQRTITEREETIAENNKTIESIQNEDIINQAVA